MRLHQDLKEFAVRGNVIDMAVGIMIGAAFTSVVNSLVKDIFTPMIGLLKAGMNFADWFVLLRAGKEGGPYTTLEAAAKDGAITMNLGLFINALVSFAIVAAVLFFLVRAANRMKRPEVQTSDPVKTKECPYCFSNIALKATRCPQCTSQLPA